ncbi:MAG: alanine--tRNA ligase [Elusimicrobiota bacterium]
MINSSDLRLAFIDFFAARGHAVRASAPLVPPGDQTLMFNSAGMVPFKPYFLGLKTDLPRATSCQKCLRTTDIERVGATARHLTFFEMLGNFSFGDYFKKETIAWAWEFLTKTAGLDPKKLHPTVFKDDDEAFAIWKSLGAPNPVSRLGKETNFWDMGPTGPCGPCSEIYFDRGRDMSCGKPGCAPGCDCDRYLEVWNLVFTQFDRKPDGGLADLPRRNIDTGMGLERLAMTVAGAASPFETDLFKPILDELAGITTQDAKLYPCRIIADHARAAVMLSAEGVSPSNIERGYVLRRLIRRAARCGRLLGLRDPFLHKLVPAAIGIFKDAYPDAALAAAHVHDVLKTEEEKFLETLENGERELETLLGRSGAVLPGDAVFKLHDTFGFPLELTREIAAARGTAIDEEGFRQAAAKAQDAARASWKGSGAKAAPVFTAREFKTEFAGYESLEEVAAVAAVAPAENGRPAALILDKTPFYPEGGGQVGDQGEIWSADGKTRLARVLDAQKQGAAVVHVIADENARVLIPGARVLARVDAARRARVVSHHTATHLLNAVLRRVLGPHVRQAGSYVGPDKLRFDFTHPKPLGPEIIARIEGEINSEIRNDDPVWTRVDDARKAEDYGAVTLPGEDYGPRPRFVLVNAGGWDAPKERFSLELCGGTHARRTSDLLAFKIIKESSASAGVRRIEAVAGAAAKDYLREKEREEKDAVQEFLTRQKALIGEIAALDGSGGAPAPSPANADLTGLRLKEKELKDRLASLKSARADAGAGVETVAAHEGISVCVKVLEEVDPKSLRGLADKLKEQTGSALALVAARNQGKISFVLTAGPPALERGIDAAKIAKALAAERAGSAGGRADFAQGGMADGNCQTLGADIVRLIGQAG